MFFRAATALFGHLGIEWDLTEASETELTELENKAAALMLLPSSSYNTL